MRETLLKHGLTVPQILCASLVYPGEVRKLYRLYKALEDATNEADIKAIESKALSVRLGMGFAENGELYIDFKAK